MGMFEARHAAVVMGRAERRQADKRNKKTGGRSALSQSSRGRDDVLPRTEVLARLSEIPVFGIKSGAGFLTAEDGAACFYLDAREAERMCSKLSGDVRVEGLPLSEVYFDPKCRLKAADSALRQLETVPPSARLDPKIKVPLFCVDGLQTTDKTTGVASLPLFNCKLELLEFAVQVYGEDLAPKKVLVTDLAVVVSNMINGPAGLLRSARFFPDAKALTWMDEQIARKKTSMFPSQMLSDAPGIPDTLPLGIGGGGGWGGGGLFGGLKDLFPR